MKSLGDYSPPETTGISFVRLATPCGRVMPRAPITGELFTLEADMPEPDGRTPWFGRGTYTYDGRQWIRLNDSSRRKCANPIGSQKVDIDAENISSLSIVPSINAGHMIASIAIAPSHRKASFSGSATFWFDVEKACHLWCAVFQGKRLVAITACSATPGMVQTQAISFVDSPGSPSSVAYSLRVFSDVEGVLFINQSNSFNFDAHGQTAFIVEENN